MRVALIILFSLPLLLIAEPLHLLPEHRSLDWKEPGAWIVPHSLGTPQETHVSQNNVQYLLFESQTHLELQEGYIHYAYKVLDETGVEEFSRVEITFDPHYECLHLHSIAVHQGSERDRVETIAKAILVEREKGLEYNIYDGRLSLVLFLKDIRPGDIVEVSFTRQGFNPILHHHYANGWELGYPFRIEKIAHRILRKEGRNLSFLYHGTDVKVEERSLKEGLVESQIEIIPSFVYVGEENTPSWYDDQPWIEVSNFNSWKEVIEWGLELFAVSKIPSEMQSDALVKEWEESSITEEEKVLKALRFVQDQIRYLGFEMGIHGFKPRPPDEVLLNRYGDCKDKSLLLKYLLEKMGIRSTPCLVNTRLQHKIADNLPNYSAFNHAILMVTLGDKKYWLDPTRKYQGGDLEQSSQGFYRYGLELDAINDALTPLRRGEEKNGVSIDSHFLMTPDADTALLTVTTIFADEEANGFRASLVRIGREKMSENYRNYYAGKYKKVTIAQPFEIEDNRDTNRFIVKECYQLEGIKEEDECFAVPSPLLNEVLEREIVLERKAPLYLYYPFQVKECTTISYPNHNFKITPVSEAIDHRCFRFAASVEQTVPDEVKVVYEYQSFDDHVGTGELETFRDALHKADATLFYTVSLAEEEIPPSKVHLQWIFLVGGLGFLVWFFVFRIKKTIRSWV